MHPPVLINKTIRVQNIRSQNPKGIDGAIFSGAIINMQGYPEDPTETVVVKVPFALLDGIQIEKGQWWDIYGETEVYQRELNGYHLKERQLLPHQMQLLRPSGEHIIQFIADNKAFQGLGRVKVQQLWESFGNDLYRILDEANVSQLTQVISTPIAHNLVDAWQQYGDTKTLQWLVQNNFPVIIGKKIIAAYGKDATTKIEEDPYRLLSFNGKWQEVDKLAIQTFKIAPDDPRRLQGAIEESLYWRFSLGDTAVPLKNILNKLDQLLQTHKIKQSELTSQAMITGFGKGSFIMSDNGELVLHALGPYIMEKKIAQEILYRTKLKVVALSEKVMFEQLQQFEQQKQLTLNIEQRQAVISGISYAIAIICGGAGTGKTTTLEALYHLYDKAGITIHQMALAGKAAKRMKEITGREATTIAGFLRNVDKSAFDDKTVLVIDEASMIDVATIYQVLQQIPSETRILLSGDRDQLASIGAGLVLHDLLKSGKVPVTELNVVNRYGGDIAKVAESVRNGSWLDISNDPKKEICFIPCNPSELQSELLTIYSNNARNSGDVQILEPVKKGKYSGTKTTNQNCQEMLAKNAPKIKFWNEEFEQFERLSMREGEPVLCTRNHWEKDLQNGSLGTIINVYPEPQEQFDCKDQPTGEAYADIQWDDGQIRALTEDLIDDIELAYSITVHKAQGSQWDTIIFPVYKCRNLDRSLLYTAITRAKKKVILLGDPDIAKQAVLEIPHSFQRITGLCELLYSDVV